MRSEHGIGRRGPNTALPDATLQLDVESVALLARLTMSNRFDGTVQD